MNHADAKKLKESLVPRRHNDMSIRQGITDTLSKMLELKENQDPLVQAEVMAGIVILTQDYGSNQHMMSAHAASVINLQKLYNDNLGMTGMDMIVLPTVGQYADRKIVPTDTYPDLFNGRHVRRFDLKGNSFKASKILSGLTK